MKYYFAYGSNLDQKQMKSRCPDSKLIGPAVLDNFKLDFTIFSPRWGGGCADIIKKDGEMVWGLIYEVSNEDLNKLDEFEGCNKKRYRRIEVEVTNGSGNKLKVYSYEVAEKVPFSEPTNAYLDIIKKAAADFKFPDDYKDMLAEVNFLPNT